MIDGLDNSHCYFEGCGLIDGTARGYTIRQTTTVSNGHDTLFKHCHSDSGVAIIDRNGARMNSGFFQFFGQIMIKNQNHATQFGNCWINMAGGAVIIDSTCTTGAIYISGNCTVIDNSNGTLVDTSQVTAGWDALAASHNKPNTMGARLNTASAGGVDYDQLATAVWTRPVEATFTAEQILRIAAAVLAGEVSGAGTGTETFTGIDGSTIRVVSTIDSNGNRTNTVLTG
jgi:hypothetical protein